MNRQQLRTWLIDRLKAAEPLDRESTIENPWSVAVTAAKKLALLGLSNSDLYRQANAVQTPQDCAAVLTDCLAALGECDATTDNLLTVKQAAERLQVSQTVIRDACQAGTLRHSRFGRGRGTIRIAADDLEAFQRDAGPARPRLRHLA